MVQYENLEDIKFLPFGNNVYYIEKFKVGIYNGIYSNENSLFTLYVCPEYCFECDDLKQCSSNKNKEEISQIILNKDKQIIDEKIINDYNITISEYNDNYLNNCETVVKYKKDINNKLIIAYVLDDNRKFDYLHAFKNSDNHDLFLFTLSNSNI